jgi:hypothetical protein
MKMNWDRIEGDWKQFKGSALDEKQLADWEKRLHEIERK